MENKDSPSQIENRWCRLDRCDRCGVTGVPLWEEHFCVPSLGLGGIGFYWCDDCSENHLIECDEIAAEQLNKLKNSK